MPYDEFGNPIGKAFDLGSFDDERLKSERILFYINYISNQEPVDIQDVVNAVKERNLQMDVIYRNTPNWSLSRQALRPYSQLWYLGDSTPWLTMEQVDAVKEFTEDGHGLLLWGDNDPYYADVNQLAGPITGTYLYGNQMADQLLTPGTFLTPGKFIEHPLTNGLNSLYEGITICSVQPAEHITILAQSHDGQNCMAVYEYQQKRVVFDTGFTKVIGGRFHRTAGTGRYFRNIAFWLAQATRDSQYKLLTGPEHLATIQQGQSSEWYGYDLKDSDTLLVVLSWEGKARLGLTIQAPSGEVHLSQEFTKSPARVEIPFREMGMWKCQVTGKQTPSGEMPYVLTVVQQKPKVPAQVPQVRTLTVMPCFVLIDCSIAATMLQPQIAEGVSRFVHKLRESTKSDGQVLISISGCRTGNQQLAPLVPIDQLTSVSLPISGEFILGSLFEQALSLAENSYTRENQKSLFVTILSSPPVDESDALWQRLHALREKGVLNSIAIDLSGSVSSKVMRQLGTIPLRVEISTQKAEAFQWAADVVIRLLKSISSAGKDRQVPLPALPPGITLVQ